MKRAYFLLLAFLFMAGTSYGFDISGLQPVAPYGVFSTFSAESLPKSKAAFEVGFERSNDPDFYRFSARGAYGISDSIEFDITVPYVFNFADSVDGMEDIAFGFKHRFYNEGKYGPSLAYLLNVSINNGRDEFGTSGRFGAGLIISKRVGPFKGHMNFFYEKPGTGTLKDEITFLGGIEFSAAHNFKMLGEILARKSHFSNNYDQVEARFGYRFRTTDSIYTTLGVGTDLKRRSPELRILIAISYAPPEKKKEIKKIFEEE
ncbi:MAG: hypothetical protein M0Z67_00890 [Nitrospiraceae bacterium]|nr:hypothetical protein [Nitrospiraceae bacterium]